MSAEIPASGVFPVEQAPTLEWRSTFKNYSSVDADPEGAAMELGRYLDKGFAKRMSRQDAQQRFGSGAVSKLALIVKEKGDGTIKRRVIIDLLRSGGNGRARVPERIVLPRCSDFVDSVRRLWSLKERRMKEADPLDDLEADSEDEDDGVELVGADLSDAYCHFGVAADELKNCLAPALEEDEILVFCAVLFGFKGAPLIMGRLSAALGLRICWIGVQLELVASKALLMLTVPEKVVNELLAKMKEWKGKGMIAFRDLRATTGKLSWMAGIVPRMRWCRSCMPWASVEADMASGTRAAGRPDKRPKVGLVPAKRVELPRSSAVLPGKGWALAGAKGAAW